MLNLLFHHLTSAPVSSESTLIALISILQIVIQPPLAFSISQCLRKPPVHAEADKHGTCCCDGRPPAPHAKHALALSDDGFLCLQLRVSGHVGKSAEADECCAACRQVSFCQRSSEDPGGSAPTTRQGVQSSNCALSCFSASLKVGG